MDKKKEIEHWYTDVAMEYHKKQFMEPKRSTVAFDNFLSSHTSLTGRVLDLACGGGAVDVYLAKHHQKLSITGIDLVGKSFGLFDELADNDVKERVNLEIGDWYNLNPRYINSFDGVISVQTLSWLQEWKTPIDKIISLNPNWIGLSSLFYEGKIDYQIKLKDYERESITGDYEEMFYNIYSIPIIKEYLAEKGYSVFEYSSYEIDIDIPKPEHNDLGTYTIKTEYGTRLQMSAAMLMPWYFLYAAKK